MSGASPRSPIPPLGLRSQRPKKYEIHATWESAEIAPFAGDIRIPTSVVEPGRVYRVRCRMKDLVGLVVELVRPRPVHGRDRHRQLDSGPAHHGDHVPPARLTERGRLGRG